MLDRFGRWISWGAVCLASAIVLSIASPRAEADPVDVVPDSPDVFVDIQANPPLDGLGANLAFDGFDLDFVLDNWIAEVFPTELPGAAGYDSTLGDSGVRLDLELDDLRQDPEGEGIEIRFDAGLGNSSDTFPEIEPISPNNSFFPDMLDETSVGLEFELSDDETNQPIGTLLLEFQIELLGPGDVFSTALDISVLTAPGTAGYQVAIPVDLAFNPSAPPVEPLMSIVVGAQFLPIPEPGPATLIVIGLMLLASPRSRSLASQR